MAIRFFNPAPQFFDSNGEPLGSGYLYFYEVGSATPKNTYSDNDLSIPNANPLRLSASGVMPNVYLDGPYKVNLTDKDGVQQPGWPRDNVNSNPLAPFDPWDAGVTYGLNEIVTGSDGYFYVSLIANNTNNDPISSPSDWELFAYKILGVASGTTGQVVTTDATTDLGFALKSPGKVGGLVYISSATASNNATIDFTGITSAYDEYIVSGLNIIPATDNVALYLRTSTDGGATFDSGIGDYEGLYYTVAGGSAFSSTGFTAAQMTLAAAIGSDANETGCSFWLHIVRPSEATYCMINWEGSYVNASPNTINMGGTGRRNAAADVNAIRFFQSSGNVESGIFHLYGVAKS